MICSVQAFLPAVILRQQAFKSLQEQTAAAKQLHVPAAWHVGVSNVVSLAVGAGTAFAHCFVSYLQLFFLLFLQQAAGYWT